MKYILINGSPRKKGNTHYSMGYCKELLDSKGDFKGEIINLAYSDIRHCLGCEGCKGVKRCIQRDDFNEIYKKLLDSQIVVLGTPVYLGMPTSLITAFLQRVTMVEYMNERRLSGKFGSIIAIAGEAGHVAAINSLTNFFLVNNMNIIGSKYWNIGTASNKGELVDDEQLKGYIESFVSNIEYMSAISLNRS